jgi:hypothetical protein
MSKVKVKRLFTEQDMAAAFNYGFAQGWVRTVPANKPEEVVRLFQAWMDGKYLEGCEAELRAEETIQ